MANKAYRIMPNGEKTLFPASRLTDSSIDNKSEYICAGTGRNGQECKADMVPCYCQEGSNYFKAVGAKHVDLCPYDESRSGSTISHLDISGKGFSLMEYYRKNKDTPNKGEKGGGGNGGSNTGGPGPTDPEPGGPIVRVAKKPDSLSEIYYALQCNDVKNNFGGDTVENQIFDQRTHNYHRTRGINGLMLVVACKGWAEIQNAPPDSIYLLDPFLKTDDRIIFLMEFKNENVRRKVGEIIFKTDETHFLVLAEWKPHPDQKNTYIATINRHSLVARLPKL